MGIWVGVCTFEMPSSKRHEPRGDEVVGILAGTPDEVLFRVVPCSRQQTFHSYEGVYLLTLLLLHYSNLPGMRAQDNSRNA